MPCSDDEEHYPNGTCQGERITPRTKQQQKQLRKSVFWSFLPTQNNKAI